MGKVAETEGFEPSIRGYRIHTFQACSFNHSDTSPKKCRANTSQTETKVQVLQSILFPDRTEIGRLVGIIPALYEGIHSMNGITLFCFVLLLPALACLGYDGYMYYLSLEEDKGLPFSFTDLGYLWVTYAPDSHDWALDLIGKQAWGNIVSPVLQLPAVLIFLLLALPFYIGFGICWLFGARPFSKASGGKKKKKDEFRDRKRPGKRSFEYNRK